MQLRRSPHKELSWPLYWSAVRMRVRGSVCLVVITTRDSVARWASETLARVIPAVGQWRVIGPATTVRIVEPTAARRDPEAVLLSALIHAGREDVALVPAIADAFSTLLIERGMLIQDLLVSRLSRQALDALEVIMQKTDYVWKSDFARQHRAEGHAQGHAQGHIEALRAALFAVLDSRSIVLSEEQRAAVTTCTDAGELERWVRQAATATSAAEALALAPPR